MRQLPLFLLYGDCWICHLRRVPLKISQLFMTVLPAKTRKKRRSWRITEHRYSCTQKPYMRLAFRQPAGFFGNLDRCFICHQILSFQDSAVHVIIHWFEIMLGTVNVPTSHNRPADPDTTMFKLFLLVKRHWHRIFIIHDMCCQTGWRKAAGYKGYNKVSDAQRCCYAHIRRCWLRAILKGHEKDHRHQNNSVLGWWLMVSWKLYYILSSEELFVF